MGVEILELDSDFFNMHTRCIFEGETSSLSTASSSGPSTGDESGFVHQLRGRISRIEKDLVAIHAVVAIVKKKGELAIEAKQYAQEEALKATESLNCK
jgi:hypothetical protein